MKYSLCIDLFYLEVTPNGPVFANTEKLLEGMQLAKDTGFDTVEFWDWANKDVNALLTKKKELGINISSICAKDRGTLADATTHEMAIEGLKRTISVAKQFDCNMIIVTAQTIPGISREESHKNIVDGLKKMTAIAEEAGVTLILEPILGSYFKDSAEPFEIIDKVGSENLKLLYDLFHYQLMEGNIVNTIKNNLDKIGHIHIASTPYRTEITDGELNYNYLLKAIKNMGYENYVALEYRPTTDKQESLLNCRKLFA